MQADPLVTLRHMRMAGVCAAGARAWFGRTSLSFEAFVRQGIPASAIEATGDAIALRVAAEARREAIEAAAAPAPVAAAAPAPVAEVTSVPPASPEDNPEIMALIQAAAKLREESARGQ